VEVRRPTPVELGAIVARLEVDYRDRFVGAGASGFDAWANGAKVGVEARFGKTSGPAWLPSVRYARRTGWLGLVGPLTPFRSLEAVEQELRQRMDEYLARLRAGYKPRALGE
jgi:hypothetical protein